MVFWMVLNSGKNVYMVDPQRREDIMGLLRDAEEMYDAYATFFDLLGRESRIGLSFASAGLVVPLRLNDPDDIVALTVRDKPMQSGTYGGYILGECNSEPDVTFGTCSDLRNRFPPGKGYYRTGIDEGPNRGKKGDGEGTQVSCP